MKASFSKMPGSTADDWKIIVPEQMVFLSKSSDRILAYMELL